MDRAEPADLVAGSFSRHGRSGEPSLSECKRARWHGASSHYLQQVLTQIVEPEELMDADEIDAKPVGGKKSTASP
jgi:hypothetical protein